MLKCPIEFGGRQKMDLLLSAVAKRLLEVSVSSVAWLWKASVWSVGWWQRPRSAACASAGLSGCSHLQPGINLRGDKEGQTFPTHLKHVSC